MIISVFVVVFGLYAALTLYIYLNQNRMVFIPFHTFYDTPAAIGVSFREVTLTTPDGIKLHSWYVGSNEGRPVVLFCHGNAGNISFRMDTLAVFKRLGLDVFLFDYRGYGKSEGQPTEEGAYVDGQTAWDYLVEKEGIEPGRIILMGRSLGGAVAARLALKVKAAGLILESTFTSIPDMGAKFYPYLPIRLLTNIHFNTLRLIKKLELPILVVHSPQDELVPYSHGKALFEAAVCQKTFLEISGSHNQGFVDSGKTYINGLRKFIDEL
ncbi:MAG: alpha/beta hydrolase [bacterium]|nr:alpha/beta hydrolase [bacterium]